MDHFLVSCRCLDVVEYVALGGILPVDVAWAVPTKHMIHLEDPITKLLHQYFILLLNTVVHIMATRSQINRCVAGLLYEVSLAIHLPLKVWNTLDRIILSQLS